MKIAKKLTYYKGLISECLACLILFMKGYKILKRNYHVSHQAQIDILALKNNQIIMVEVKFRKKLERSIGAISTNQEQRIKNTAYYLEKKYKKQIRFDGMFFSFDYPFFKHYKNIFEFKI